MFPPVSTLGVATNPVVLAIISEAKDNNRNRIVQLWICQLLRENASKVLIFKLGSSLNSALNWTVLENFTFHLIGTYNPVVLTFVIMLEGHRSTVLIVKIPCCRYTAVFADIKIGEESSLKDLGYVTHAAAIWNTIAVGIIINQCEVPPSQDPRLGS